MMPLKSVVSAAALAVAGTFVVAGPASAGTWYVDASTCPDLREDLRDQRRGYGRQSLHDRRDRAQINCPTRSWSYEPSRWDDRRDYLRDGAHNGSPGVIRVGRDGRYYRTGHYGEQIAVDVRVYTSRPHDRYRYHPRDRYDRYSRYDRYDPYGHHRYRNGSGASITFTFGN
ncbi:hypothetical protein [Maricaulis sp. CAU 1757]